MIVNVLARSITATFVGASTASIRRSTSSGNITEPYSCCLKVPRSLSATFHTNATLSWNPCGAMLPTSLFSATLAR